MQLVQPYSTLFSKESRILWALLLGILCQGIFPTPSDAIPAFARKYDLSCTSCHTKPPRLNPFGEAFHMAGFQIPMVREGEIKRKKRIGRIYSETDLLNILSIRAAGSLVESHIGDEAGETELHFPETVEIYLAGTFTDSISYFFELENESSEIEGLEDGRFEETSRFGIGKEFFLMADIPRLAKDVLTGGRSSSESMMHGAQGRAGPMVMGPMIMVGKIDPSTNFSYPTNRQFILNVPGKVDETSGMMKRFSMAPYAFALKFYGVQTGSGESVQVTKEVLYNTQGGLGVDVHMMVMPLMIQGGVMQGLMSGTADINQKKDPYLMARINFGSSNYISGSVSGLVYWGNDTARVPITEGSTNTTLVDWLRYGGAANIRYQLIDIYGAFIVDKIKDLPAETLDVFDEEAKGLTVEVDFIASDALLISVRYDQLDAGGFVSQKAQGKVLTGQLRHYLRDNFSFYLRDSYNVEEVTSNPLQSFRNLVTLGVDMDF